MGNGKSEKEALNEVRASFKKTIFKMSEGLIAAIDKVSPNCSSFLSDLAKKALRIP